MADRSRRSSCPDCPSVRLGVLGCLVDGPTGCVFASHRVASRDPLPSRWFDEYDFGVVRHGVVVRQRISEQGVATSVDVSGSGGLILLPSVRAYGPAYSGYAATDLSVCLLTREVLTRHDDGTCFRDLHLLEALALERIERLMDARGRSNAMRQVAALLCALSDTLCPGRTRVIMPPDLRRSDLASLLGLRRETLSRQLSLLATQGTIRRGPEGIQIVDRAALENSRALANR